VTARIPVELMEKIKYLEINVTDVIRDSLWNEVKASESLIVEIVKLKEWKSIGGLPATPEPTWRQLEGLSGEELTRARIRYVANIRKEVRRNAEELARNSELE
jgi:hypothetical protein